MLVHRLVAPLLGASCSVISDGGRCVVVDPGGGAAAEIRGYLDRGRLTPLAVLVTHGHVDHVWDAGALADGWGVPVYVHEADAYRLADPFGSLGPMGEQLRAMAPGLRAPEPPRDLRTFTGADGPVVLELAAAATPDAALPGEASDAVAPESGAAASSGRPAPFALRALHLPGHTEGSTVYLLDAAVTEDLRTPGAAAGRDPGPVALTGDVLFAGSIGRTDLPGGDHRAMTRSLRRLRVLDPATMVIPGHGPTTTIRAELATNPYL